MTTDKKLRLGSGAFAGVLALALCGCTTPAAVSQFCGSATITLTVAKPVFADLKGSCLREVNSRAELGSFTAPSSDDAACAAIGKQADGAVAAATVLTEYFQAINALAVFGTAKAGSDAEGLATKAAAAVGANAAASTALSSIAKFLVTAATSGYQARQLGKDLPAASANISAVTGALVTIVEEDYVGRLLKSEEQKVAIHYKEFARGKSPEVVLTLDARWQADERELEERRACARSLVVALRELSKGFAELAANSHRLKGKDAAGLLGPYVAELQELIPQIQKAF